MLRRFLRRVRNRFGPALQSDTAFIEAAYFEILGRPADQDGLDHYKRVLQEGLGRTAVLLSLVRSEEFTRRLSRPAGASIASLRLLRPDRYRSATDRTNGESITVFDVHTPSDFDWLEHGILENEYYELPGVWNLGIDVDKRVVAEIVASFAPARALELGCAAGAVLKALEELGVVAEGVEISVNAIAQAADSVRGRIHRGDLLSLDLQPVHDLVFGLDVFEHLNPNRMNAYLARLAGITRDDAFFFCNIPAFGDDEVFGTVFPLYVEGWEQDAAARRPFSSLHVDDLGYPKHGHLTWADTRWWVERFRAAGLQRDVEVERALHRKYDRYMERRAPARRAFFVFAKQGAERRRPAILQRIAAEPSRTLERLR
jgi:hypothetical protein